MGEVKEKKEKEAAPMLGPRILQVRGNSGPGSIGRHKLVPDPDTGKSKPITLTGKELRGLCGCLSVEVRAVCQAGDKLKVVFPWAPASETAIRSAIGLEGKK